MFLEGKVKLEVAYATNWADQSSPYLGDLGYQPVSWDWVDVTEGLISAEITRGVTEYEGPWSQIDPGQLIVTSRNPQLDPNNNPDLAAYGHKIRIIADDQPIFTGKIREVDVEYFNDYDPQIITINAFDAWQQLVDYSYENEKLVAGLDETEPEANLVKINLGSIWQRIGMGPVFNWNGSVWNAVSKVLRGYKRWGDPSDYQLEFGDATTYKGEWNPLVYLDPYNLQGWGNTTIANITHRTTETSSQGGYDQLPMTINISDTDPFGDVWFDGSPYPNGMPWDVRHFNVIDYPIAGIGDITHPLYVTSVYPSSTTIPYGVVTYATSLDANGISSIPQSKSNGGFVACISNNETNFLSALQMAEQSEQGFIYVDARDNIFVLNRVLAKNAVRDKHLTFASDGSGVSYKRLTFKDGVKNIVNKLIVNNVSYSTNNPVVSEYQNENHLTFDTQEQMRLIDMPGAPYKIYGNIEVPERRITNLTTETFTFVDEESIKRYGERALELNTNYAWGLEETFGTQQDDAVWYGYEVAGGDPLDPRTSGGSSAWRFAKIYRNDNETLKKEIWSSNRGVKYSLDETYNRNAVARAAELGTMIINNFAYPRREIQAINWEVNDDTELANAANTDIFDKIDINHSSQGVTFNKEYQVMGIKHRIDLNRWEIEYQLWNQEGQP